ncbi:MAG: 5-formyltetrahydrofolate cyclo-ligase [Clostridia bacterium]|nr:5-formyltetrahydrofolate cyclo-ligase [Clostridia bacterium]
MNLLREQKNRIREEFKALRREMDPKLKELCDRKICQRFMSLASYRFADTLLLYAPLKYEIDIMPIADDAIKRGKTVAFPLCDPVNHTMVYHIISDLSDLKEGSYGIREPDSSKPVYDPKSHKNGNSVCFVPGLVFDRNGYRIGYGKGFYDRYLSLFSGSKMGVEYSSCVVDTLPRGRFDTAVDFLVTEKGVITINAN